MTSKINYIQKNRIQCICVIVICGLIFNNRKNKYEKNITKIFIVLKYYTKSINYKYLAYYLK